MSASWYQERTPGTNEQWLINRSRFGQHRLECPWCGPTRRKKGESTLSYNRDDTSIKYTCHHCGVSGLVIVERRAPVQIEEKKPILRKKREDFGDISDPQIGWLSGRGISVSTAGRYELIGDEIFGKPIVGFPYYDEKGNVVAVKQRYVEDKRFTCWQSPQSFFGLKHIKKGDDLVIVEGEMDVLALAEAGVNAISVPNGAPMKVHDGRIDPAEDNKFKFLWAAKEYLDAAKRIVIATDADVPGEALAEEIARRIGKERCWRVKFPEGIKDSNDYLLREGKEALKKAVEGAEPWPVRGLYDAEHFRAQVEELYTKGIGRGESTGYNNVDEFYTIVEGQITIVTGIPSSGKSEFIDQLMINLASSRGWKFGICSFENEPRLHIAKLMSKRSRHPFFEGYHKRMDQFDFRASFDFINDHFTFVHQDDGSLADLDSILDRLRVSVLRHGIRGAVIDPYNFINRDRSDKSETEWISDMLTKVKAFAMAHGIHIWFVAHPTKLQRNADGKIPPPGGYDISGSAAWFAKADCGVTVHREKEEPHVTQVHIWKCRFSWVGKQGEARLVYDVGTTCYTEVQQDDQQGEEGFAL
jgi:twinkle protein